MEDAFDVQRDHLALMKDLNVCCVQVGRSCSRTTNVASVGSRRPGKTGTESTRNYAKNVSQDFARNRQIHNCWLITAAERNSNVINQYAWRMAVVQRRPLLDNAELHIEDNERVCLVAATAQANRR